MAAVLGAAWAVAIVLALAGRRPAPARVRALVAPVARRPPVAATGGVPRLSARTSPAVAVGRAVRGAGRRAPDDVADRRVGRTVLAAVAGAAVWAPLGLVGGAAAWVLPLVDTSRARRRHDERVLADLPEVVDLLGLAVGAGLTVPMAVAVVARRAPGEVGAALRHVADAIALGRRAADAIDDLPALAGEGLRPVSAALAASDRYGVALGPALAVLAVEVRADRRRRAEAAARRVPVKLLFPLVLCVLPAFGLLTVVPLLAGAAASLHL